MLHYTIPVLLVQKLDRWLHGYLIDSAIIAVRQQQGWIELPKSQIAIVKFETVSKVIVRLHSRKRYVLDLFRFSLPDMDRIVQALREAVQSNEQTKASKRSARTSPSGGAT